MYIRQRYSVKERRSQISAASETLKIKKNVAVLKRVNTVFDNYTQLNPADKVKLSTGSDKE